MTYSNFTSLYYDLLEIAYRHLEYRSKIKDYIDNELGNRPNEVSLDTALVDWFYTRKKMVPDGSDYNKTLAFIEDILFIVKKKNQLYYLYNSDIKKLNTCVEAADKLRKETVFPEKQQELFHITDSLHKTAVDTMLYFRSKTELFTPALVYLETAKIVLALESFLPNEKQALFEVLDKYVVDIKSILIYLR